MAHPPAYRTRMHTNRHHHHMHIHSLTRELHDTPSLQVGRAAVAYLLSAVEGLNPANMALLAGLLVGPCASGAGGVRPLYDYPKGRFVLRVAARQWHVQATGIPAAAGG